MTAMTTSALAAFSPEVRKFAAAQGVDDHLPAVLDMTRTTFPTSPFAVSLAADAEDEEDRYVLFEIDVAGLELAQLNAARQRWARELPRHCPSTHTINFRLGLV